MSNLIQNEEKLYQHPIYLDYACNLNGEVFSLKFGKIKKLKLSKSKGYLIFNIYCNKKLNKKVHQFVWECFNKIEQWSNLTSEGLTINHKDSNKLNNKIENLELKTQRENTQLKECNKQKNKKSKLPKDVRFVKNNKSNPFKVQILFKGEKKYFGSFSSIQEAEEVAIKQRKLLFPNE
jgi:hypothetical protein